MTTIKDKIIAMIKDRMKTVCTKYEGRSLEMPDTKQSCITSKSSQYDLMYPFYFTLNKGHKLISLCEYQFVAVRSLLAYHYQ